MKTNKFIFFVLMLLVLAGPCFAQSGPNFFDGDWQGSKIRIAEPESWNKQVLILAHKYREAHLPLTADFAYANAFFKTLIDNGWMVASTSYRTNGIAFKEGLEDIGLLKDFIIEKYGRPEKIYLHGESMGGSIAILLSERNTGDYSGALCIDPAIRDQLNFTHRPMIPVLFLSNQNEADQVRGYLDKLEKDAVSPAFWIVQRDGHLNVNALEHLEAFNALVDRVEGRPMEMTRKLLIIPLDQPSNAIFKDNGLYSRITRVHPKYGNLDTEITPDDCEKLGIQKGEMFTVQCGENKARVFLGTSFSDVEKGRWIAFFKEDGLLKIARNLDSAQKILQCREGEMVFIAK